MYTALLLLSSQRILRYVHGTISLGMHYTNACDLDLCGFTDSNWSWDIDDRKSILATVSFWVPHAYLG